MDMFKQYAQDISDPQVCWGIARHTQPMRMPHMVCSLRWHKSPLHCMQ